MLYRGKPFVQNMTLRLLNNMMSALTRSVVSQLAPLYCGGHAYDAYVPLEPVLRDSQEEEEVEDVQPQPPLEVNTTNATQDHMTPGDGGAVDLGGDLRGLTGRDTEPQDLNGTVAQVVVTQAPGTDVPNAVFVAPDIVPLESYVDSAGNLAEAVRLRVEEPHNTWSPSNKLKSKLKGFTDEMLKHAFAEERVHEWVLAHPWFEDLKSAKWSSERLWAAVDELLEKHNYIPKSTAQIKKNEQMPRREVGKPRLVINFGENQQVACLALVSCVEHLLFEWFHQTNIKHAAKLPSKGAELLDYEIGEELEGSPEDGSLHRVVNSLRKVDATTYVEGDGSAWDATISLELMGLMELRILARVWKTMVGDEPLFLGVPTSATNAQLNSRKKKELKASMKGNFLGSRKVAELTMSMIRQSGDRGTSCLNYLVNCGMWACVTLSFKGVKDYVRARGMPGHYQADIGFVGVAMNECVPYNAAFEGDDSLVACDIYRDPANVAIAQDAWKSAGFNMKLRIVSGTGYVTFVGVEILVEEKLQYVFLPTVRRNIASCATTSDTGPNFRQTAYMSLHARAVTFGRCGAYSLARYFLLCGKHWEAFRPGSDVHKETEKQIKFRIGDNYKESFWTEIEEIGNAVEDSEGARKLLQVHCNLTDDEYLAFASRIFGHGTPLAPSDTATARMLLGALRV
jgi:hypothetical protein